MIKNNIPIEKAIQNISNENLLVNSDFRNPVNTTGKLEWNINAYTEAINEWYSNNTSCLIELTDRGIKISTYIDTYNFATFGQTLSKQDTSMLKGKKMTFTSNILDFSADQVVMVAYLNDGMVHNNPSFNESHVCSKGINKFTFELPNDVENKNLTVYIYSQGTNSYCEIEWMKLEIGDKSTPLEYEDSKVKQLKTDGVPLLYGGESIPSNADLNNYVNVGNYYCASHNTATTLKNTPSGLNKAFTMEVKAANGIVVNGSGYCYYSQKIEDLDGRIFKRNIGFINGNYDFIDWVEVLTDREVLLWSGSMATGQSAVVDGLGNFNKFKVYVNDTGLVAIDFKGTEDKGKRKFSGEFYNYSPSSSHETFTFCSAFIDEATNTFTNCMSKYAHLKDINGMSYESPIIQIWGIY